jgi:hypothetical protein
VAIAAPSWAPCLPWGKSGLAAALDDMMWIVQVEYEHFGEGLVIRGYVKPAGPASTEGEILAGFTETVEEILDVIDQADLRVTKMSTEIKGLRDGLEMQLDLTIQEYA